MHIRCIQVDIKVSVCLLGCSFKSTDTLIFAFTVTDIVAITAVFQILACQKIFCSIRSSEVTLGFKR